MLDRFFGFGSILSVFGFRIDGWIDLYSFGSVCSGSDRFVNSGSDRFVVVRICSDRFVFILIDLYSFGSICSSLDRFVFIRIDFYSFGSIFIHSDRFVVVWIDL